MARISFKQRFVDRIISGLKTIRTVRKRPIKPGETLHLHTGSRFKPVRIGHALCKAVLPIRITQDSIAIGLKSYINTEWELNDFAISDGFSSWQEMKLWWIKTHGPSAFPFEGILIQWYDFKPMFK